jgi:fumarylacetoacetase
MGHLSGTAPSFIATANEDGCDFPLHNLPYCVFRNARTRDDFHIGVGIGDQVLDLRQAAASGLLEGSPADLLTAVQVEHLNALFALQEDALHYLRHQLTCLLAADSPVRSRVEQILVPQKAVEYGLPFAIGDYTDFFASVNHATNVGKMYRPETPLLPNFKSQPLAYHGRASSVIISGEEVRRPQGIYRDGHGGPLKFAPTGRLDFEVEIGAYIGCGNQRNVSIALDEAEQHIAGVCLVNDWSARDIQAWETQPLGPFLGKNFATTVSPWVVTLEALAPFRAPAASQADGEAPLADYLASARNRAEGGLSITVETRLRTARMREEGRPAEKITSASFARDSYWTLGQMVAHHTINGCNLRSGDLLASGTLSGPSEGTQGCLLELTRGGAEPLVLGNGESRTYLEDGDEVSMHAFCVNDSGLRIGFGSCHARINAAVTRN